MSKRPGRPPRVKGEREVRKMSLTFRSFILCSVQKRKVPSGALNRYLDAVNRIEHDAPGKHTVCAQRR